MNKVASNLPAAPREAEGLVHAEQVRILYRHAPATFIVNAIITVAAAILVWDIVSPEKTLFWLVLVLAAVAVRILLWLGYRRARPVPSQAAKWGRRYTFGMLFSGAGWGSASVLLFSPDALLQQLGVAVIVIGLAAGVASSAASYVAVVYAFVLSSMVPFVFVFAMQGTLFHGVFAAMTMICILGMMKFARVNYQMLTEAIALRFEVAVQRDAAEQANVAKSKFLAAASHDLRQPLHALGLFVAALDEPGSKANCGLVQNINRSLHALEQLFNALLDISKLDAGVVKPEIRDVALTPLLDRLSSEHEPQARAKGLAWCYRAAHAVVRTDTVLLETVLRNLISNAIRYTHQGEVRLTCSSTDGCVQIEVADTGVGIPPEKQQEVFREFVQLHNPERDRTKGLGLGLAIVDRLTKLLDHPLQMASKPGYGSTFALKLPCGDERLAQAAAEIDGDALLPEESPLRVLVIEDEIDAREALVALLRNWGHEVMAVASPDEVASIPGPAPDAIITDYRLREETTGSEAIHRIRRMWGRGIPALIVTGDTAPERLRQAQQSGFALLHKPVSPGKLRAFLRGVQREHGSRPVG